MLFFNDNKQPPEIEIHTEGLCNVSESIPDSLAPSKSDFSQLILGINLSQPASFMEDSIFYSPCNSQSEPLISVTYISQCFRTLSTCQYNIIKGQCQKIIPLPKIIIKKKCSGRGMKSVLFTSTPNEKTLQKLAAEKEENIKKRKKSCKSKDYSNPNQNM